MSFAADDATMSVMSGGHPTNEPALHGRLKLTYDEFMLFPDDGLRHELIDGEHYVTPSPNLKHQKVSGNLYLLIRSWLAEHPVGQIVYAPLDVVFSKHDVVEPDLLYVSNERRAAVLTSKNVQGVPELVIEIGSPSTRKRDETIKRRLYERSGVAEYWVVDPEPDTIRVYRHTAEALRAPRGVVARGRRRVDDAAHTRPSTSARTHLPKTSNSRTLPRACPRRAQTSITGPGPGGGGSKRCCRFLSATTIATQPIQVGRRSAIGRNSRTNAGRRSG